VRPVPIRLCALASLLLAGCATTRSLDLEQTAQDPWETTNRRIHAFNKDLDRVAIKPVTRAYRATVPRPARSAVSNIYATAGEPRNFIGYLLQGKISLAFRSVDRFLVNAVLGVGGITDAASEIGLQRQDTDWGQTLAMWGVRPGPYVVLPFFGPSSLRDGLATPADILLDPALIAIYELQNPSLAGRAAIIAGGVIDARTRLIDVGADGLMAGSIDEYTLLKSAWLQRRRYQLYYGNPPPTAEELEDYEPADPE
jgi:phospholipid-binding lipoprotein MlaA